MESISTISHSACRGLSWIMSDLFWTSCRLNLRNRFLQSSVGYFIYFKYSWCSQLCRNSTSTDKKSVNCYICYFTSNDVYVHGSFKILCSFAFLFPSRNAINKIDVGSCQWKQKNSSSIDENLIWKQHSKMKFTRLIWNVFYLLIKQNIL